MTLRIRRLRFLLSVLSEESTPKNFQFAISFFVFYYFSTLLIPRYTNDFFFFAFLYLILFSIFNLYAFFYI